jgi:hypothetical protein
VVGEGGENGPHLRVLGHDVRRHAQRRERPGAGRPDCRDDRAGAHRIAERARALHRGGDLEQVPRLDLAREDDRAHLAIHDPGDEPPQRLEVLGQAPDVEQELVHAGTARGHCLHERSVALAVVHDDGEAALHPQPSQCFQ